MKHAYASVKTSRFVAVLGIGVAVIIAMSYAARFIINRATHLALSGATSPFNQWVFHHPLLVLWSMTVGSVVIAATIAVLYWYRARNRGTLRGKHVM